jgi:hypothetical protein
VRLGLLETIIQSERHFYCHILSAKGLQPDKEKVRVILVMPNPTDAKGEQHLISFANYLSKFMPTLSAVCEPLRRLLDDCYPNTRLRCRRLTSLG